MKKKVVSVVLAAAMTTTLVVGCGSTGSVDTAADTSAEAAEDTEAAETTDTTETATGDTIKVAVVKQMDHASLDEIANAVEEELDAIAAKNGVTIEYETYSGQGDQSVLNQIGTQVVSEDVDVIIPIATPAAMIMQNATEDNQIPIVFSAVSDPVGAGLVASADAPGANITGTSDAIDVAQIMDFILAADPDAAKIGFLYDKSQDSSTSAIQAAKDYCDEHGISYVEKTGTTTGEIQAAADSLVAEKVDAIFTPQDNTVMTAELAIFEKFADAGIPHYTSADSFALNGAFLGYGVNYETLGTKTADMVADILANGADPATTPVETLDSGIVTVNTEIAEKVGIDYSIFKDMCSELIETVTAEEFN